MDAIICPDCIYFMQHYVMRKENFRPINCGHYLHKNRRAVRNEGCAAACKYFEPRCTDAEKISRNQSFRDTVTDMHKKLEGILHILAADENK